MKKILFCFLFGGFLFGCEKSTPEQNESKSQSPNEAAQKTVSTSDQTTPPTAPQQTDSSAFQLIQQLQSNGYQSDEALEILIAEIEKNPKASAEWAATLPPGANRDECLETVFGEWVLLDQNAAVDFARKNLSGMDLTVATAAMAEQLASDYPDSASIALSLSTEPVARGLVVASIVRANAEAHPRRAAEWTLLLRDPVEREAALDALVDVWSSTELRSTADWIDASLRGDEKTAAVEILIANWGSIDPRTASEWLAARRADLDYESTSAALASSWAMVDPRAAASWALYGTDPQSQAALVEEVMSSWTLNETARAIEWADAIGNPELRRQALLAGFGALKGDSSAALNAWIQSHPRHPAAAEAMESLGKTE